MSFREAFQRGVFPDLFKSLDQNLADLGIRCYGVMDSTLEEVGIIYRDFFVMLQLINIKQCHVIKVTCDRSVICHVTEVSYAMLQKCQVINCNYQ